MDMRKKNILIGVGELAVSTGLAIASIPLLSVFPPAGVLLAAASFLGMYKGLADALEFTFFPEDRKFEATSKRIKRQTVDNTRDKEKEEERDKEKTKQLSLAERKEEKRKLTGEPTVEQTDDTNEPDHTTKKARASSTYNYDYDKDDWFYGKERKMRNNPGDYGL